MARETVDTDMSGRPLRPIEELEAGPVPKWEDMTVAVLDDGSQAAHLGGGLYLLGDDGRPDLNRPVDPETGKPR